MTKKPRVIVTIAIGAYHEKLYSVVEPFFKAYAKKVGADLVIWRDQGNHSMPHYRKLDLGDMLNQYERVCYIDADIIIRDDAPDIFDMVPVDRFGAFEEGQFQDRADCLYQFFKKMDWEPEEDVQADYWNTGVMVFSQGHHPVFLQPEVEHASFYEQTYLNFMFHALKVKMMNLNYRMNRMSLINPVTGEDHLDGYLIHYAGYKDIHGEEFLLKRVQDDIERLKQAAPEYRFTRRFLIAVQGGIGDQVCAEPAIRELIENVYPGSEFHICSFWPDLFKHLAARNDLDVRLYDKTEDVPNAGAMHAFESYRDSNHESWGVMSQGATHMVDFCAIQILKYTLPIRKRQPQLFVSQTNLNAVELLCDFQTDFSKSVLVHAGRGWPSKTFPAKWWRDVILALKMRGLQPILIGQDRDGDHGVVKLDNCGQVDLVNKLSLQELFAITSMVPVLISNDSGPVHIAGAFDNWIGMIGGPKDPEMVLPFRGPHGDPFWRARALETYVPRKRYKDFPVRPAEIHSPSMDHIDCPIEEYLPEPESVAQFALEAINWELED
jgi:ADP-heptose:LPS heptosyltransferase